MSSLGKALRAANAVGRGMAAAGSRRPACRPASQLQSSCALTGWRSPRVMPRALVSWGNKAVYCNLSTPIHIFIYNYICIKCIYSEFTVVMPSCIATLRNNFITFQKTLVMKPRLKNPDFSTAFRGTLWIASPSASHSLISFFLLRKRITQFAAHSKLFQFNRRWYSK